jgi:uncharacterized membrane protein YqhA
MKQIETGLEKLIFNSRWLLAPFYLGLVLALALMLVKFVKEFLHFAPLVFNAEGGEVIIGVLSLIDVVMVANLLIIIVFAGYENFVSQINTGDHEDSARLDGACGLRRVEDETDRLHRRHLRYRTAQGLHARGVLTNEQLAWKVGIHMTFVVSGVLFALMDRIADGKKGHAHE